MGLIEIISLAVGASWASGINLYAGAAMIGVFSLFGLVDLPVGLDILGNPIVIIVALILYAVEFFVDKIPSLDSVWDALHTFIRIPAGALIALGAVSSFDFGIERQFVIAGALVLGALIATGAHVTKAGTRVIINTSPEPLTNWTASLVEDLMVVVGIFLAVFKPVVFLVTFAVFVLIALWIVPKIWQGIRKLFFNSRHPVAIIKADPQERMSLSFRPAHNSD